MKIIKTRAGLEIGKYAYLLECPNDRYIVLDKGEGNYYYFDLSKDSVVHIPKSELFDEEVTFEQLYELRQTFPVINQAINWFESPPAVDNGPKYDCFEREIILIAEKGTNIYNVHKEAQQIAKSTGFIVTFDWNSWKIKVGKTTTLESVYGQMQK